MTQTELANLAGTTQSAIARLESGRTRPSLDDTLRYLHLMGLDLDIMLVARDESDRGIAADALARTPQQRWDHHSATVRRFAAIRSAAANMINSHE